MEAKKTLLLFLCFCFPALYAQSYIKLYDLIDQREHKSLDQSIEKINKAEKLMQQANTFYAEAIDIQSNSSINEKGLEKKLAAVEKKAITTHMKADKQYSKAYSEIYKICDKEYESRNFSEGKEFKEESFQFINEAELKRSDARSLRNPYQKAEQLNEAESMQAEAIERIVLALEVNNEIIPMTQPIEQNYIPDSVGRIEDIRALDFSEKQGINNAIQQSGENLAIDMNAIGQYNNYVNNKDIPEPIIINRNGVRGVEQPTIETARKFIYAYETLADGSLSDNSGGDNTSQNSFTPEVDANQNFDSLNPVIGQTQVSTDTGPFNDSDKQELLGSKELIKTGSMLVSKNLEVHFMVQIAASRVPLTRGQLWGIYPGNYAVEVMKENNWYKYRLTGFRLYTDAALVAKQLAISGAWIVAIQHGSLIPLAEAWSLTKKLESDVKEYGRDALYGEIDYYVQVAAAKTRITGRKRQALCAENIECREIIEEGWFKYQISAKSDYQLALDIQERLKGKSFIVAYMLGSKLTQDRP